jgi:hypothetical protein
MKQSSTEKIKKVKLRLAIISGLEIDNVNEPYIFVLKREKVGRWFRYYLWKRPIEEISDESDVYTESAELLLDKKMNVYFTEKEIKDRQYGTIFGKYQIEKT